MSGPRQRCRPSLASAVALALAGLAGCGGAGGGAAPTAARPGGSVSPAGTVPPAATSSVQVTTERASALAGLRAYLTRVADVDQQLGRAAAAVNADVVTGGMRIGPATRSAVQDVDLTGLARALPAGMDAPLTRQALLVYSELASRRAAFNGVLEASVGPDGTATVAPGSPALSRINECLANGARAHARFDADVAALRALAAASPPFTHAAPASRASAEIAVRTRYIDGWNRCCGSCGGYVTDRLAPVVWVEHDDPVAGHTDGAIEGVAFEATYRASSGWLIELHAG